MEPASYNGDMEDLTNPQPSQWIEAPWGTAGSVDWSASTTAKHGSQSLFYTPTETPQQYDGIVKVIAATSTIAIGDRVHSNSTGRATDAGTTDNGFYAGRALTASGAAGDIITIKLLGVGGDRY